MTEQAKHIAEMIVDGHTNSWGPIPDDKYLVVAIAANISKEQAEIVRLHADLERMRIDMKHAVWSDSEECKILTSDNARLRAQRDQLVAALCTALCPGGGWNGMPKDIVATTRDCLNAGVCGCDQGAAVEEAKR